MIVEFIQSERSSILASEEKKKKEKKYTYPLIETILRV